ncbi:hypothetical protein PC129_g17049 [Phytophthora cactorum]|uniref:[F-actin]-monooxygenase MICAL1-3-like Rossman domain-containing protein n=1 Tax=Phytophthora cactorum TaxID=29920 RepID=A0A8T1HJ29_9STRA|nr:hypothetical protein PC129_g17049 [Phytophthora cactorum]
MNRESVHSLSELRLEGRRLALGRSVVNHHSVNYDRLAEALAAENLPMPRPPSRVSMFGTSAAGFDPFARRGDGMSAYEHFVVQDEPDVNKENVFNAQFVQRSPRLGVFPSPQGSNPSSFEHGDGADTGEAAEQVRHHLAVFSINGHEVGHKVRVWKEKELAWLKMRQLLIEEEEKTSTHKRRHAKSVERSAVRSEASDCKSYNTVKLLYSMASYAPQPPQLFSFNSSRSRAEVEKQPPQIFASKLGQFPGAGSDSDNAITSSKSSRLLSEHSGNTPTRWNLLATLEKVTKPWQRMELPDATMARVSEHLNSIYQIVREDMSSHQSRSHRISSTQAANDSSDSFDTYSVFDISSSHPRADVTPTVRDSFKAFTSGRALRDTLAASNNLVADCGLDGVKLQDPWHVYYHIRGAVYRKLSFRHKQLFQLLDVRFSLDVFKRRSCVNNRMCIVGAEENGGNLFYSIKTEPQIPVAEYTAVHGATGTNDTIAEPAGITRFVFSRDESLGIACYFLSLETTKEMKRKEFSWTTRLKHHMLDEMRDVGIDLENIVYSRGDIQYLIMTPKRHNLLYPSITTL